MREDVIIETVFNLILDVDLKENERQLLIDFKNKLPTENNRDSILALIDNIRRLAISNVERNEVLSEPMNRFYKDLSSYGEFERQLGRGLISYGIVR
ncbi:bacteriocin immunity protein [Streptococcus fryi]